MQTALANNSSCNLRLDNLVAKRNGVVIAQPVSINIAPGELVYLVGANGSGKTTLLRQLAGITGEPLLPDSINSIYIGHQNPFYPALTVRQQLSYWSGKDIDTKAIDKALAELGIASCVDKVFGQLSKGQQQRVALSLLCLNDYDLWLLDEPTQNLDSQAVQYLYNLMEKFLTHDGQIIMAAHHNLSTFQKVQICQIQPVNS